MHLRYSKTGETGPFSPIIFLMVLEFFLSLPFIFLFLEITSLPKDMGYIPIFGTQLILFILNCKRYYRKGKAAEIIKTYKHSKYNQSISGWMITALAFGCATIGFACIKPVLLLWSYIASLFA
jgi:hypothetical protein